jgi:hypothetical protein
MAMLLTFQCGSVGQKDDTVSLDAVDRILRLCWIDVDKNNRGYPRENRLSEENQCAPVTSL